MAFFLIRVTQTIAHKTSNLVFWEKQYILCHSDFVGKKRKQKERGRETIFYGIDLSEHYSRYIDIPSAGAYGTAYI